MNVNTWNPARLQRTRTGLVILAVVALISIGITGCWTSESKNPAAAKTTDTKILTPTSVATTGAGAYSRPEESGKIGDACWSIENVNHPQLTGSLLYYFLVRNPETAEITSGSPAIFYFDSWDSKGLKKFYPDDISLDGKMFTQLTDTEWEFLSENGSFSYPIPEVTVREESTYMFMQSDQLLWEGPSQKEEQDLNNGIYRDLYLFAPDTGTINFFDTVFLPYALWKPSPTSEKYRVALYSPDLKHVLYPANYQNANISILLNIENQEVIWYGWPSSNLGFLQPMLDIQKPIWRPDSSGVILHKEDEKTGFQNFYNLSLDGSVSQITHLEEIFSSSDYALSSPAISPDGRYLAFALIKDNFPSFPARVSLMLILDLDNGEIFNPCITLANQPYPDYPVWSPDSSAVAVIPDAGNEVLLVDLKEKEIFGLFPKSGLEAGSLLGWVSWNIP